ncbi:MAG: hypothetical protein NTU94_18385 [Planctomycetota bacterium]|nr:hypothetical protein [Planctomycetota bacterium]
MNRSLSGKTSCAARAAAPAFEALEGRTLLAGNVVATVLAGGLLRITGDAAANDIIIDQVGAAPDGVRLSSGPSATLINGLAGPVQLGGVKDLVLALGDGDDLVKLTAATFRGNVTVDGEGGALTTTVDGARFVGSVSLASDSANNLNITNSASIAGDLAIQGGAGGNVTIAGSRVGRNLTVVATGPGSNGFSMNGGTTVNGKVSLSFGDGSANVTIVQSGIRGNLDIASGMDSDSLVLDQTAVLGNVTLSAGDGNNSMLLSGAAVNGKVAMTSLVGWDTFQALNGSRIGGELRLDFGSGGSSATVNNTTVGGALTLNATDGDDTLNVVSGGQQLLCRLLDGGRRPLAQERGGDGLR